LGQPFYTVEWGNPVIWICFTKKTTVEWLPGIAVNG
jgi:hypothetical protein